MNETVIKQPSMIEPSVDSLLVKVDSRYTLVVAASKRARQLAEGSHKLTKCISDKAVTVAVNEINENKITYVRTKERHQINKIKIKIKIEIEMHFS